MKQIFIILYLFLCVVTGAVADGLNADVIQTWGHLLDALEKALLISGAFIFKPRSFIAYLLAYVFIRVATFDYIINLVRGLPLLYLGGENWWDMFLVKFPSHGVTFARVIFLITGMALPIKEL